MNRLLAEKISHRSPIELIWIVLTLSSCVSSVLFSFGLLLYGDAFKLAKSYAMLEAITSEHTIAMIGLAISFTIVAFIKTRLLIMALPLNAFYWLFLSRSIYISAEGFTPVAGLFTANAILVSLAYGVAGGWRFKSLKESDKERAGASSEQSREVSQE